MNTIFKNIYSLLPKTFQILFVIIGCSYYLGVQINNGFDMLRTDLVNEARQPAYAIIHNAIDKQMEKIEKDPSDIKQVDIRFLYDQCSGDFGKVYVAALPPSKSIRVERACETLEDMYLKGDNYYAMN